MSIPRQVSTGRSPLSRRAFIQGTATATAFSLMPGCALIRGDSTVRGTIDSHSHYYDPGRPEGVSWPPETDSFLYRTVMPDEHRRAAAPHGVTAIVLVEASPLLEDNQWLLDLADQEPDWIAGVLGRIEPGRATFRQQLTRFAAHPRFRGIRTNPQRHLLDDASVITDLRLLSDRRLSLDINCNHTHFEAVGKLASALPDLPIIINHIGQARIDGRQPTPAWAQAVRAVARYRNVHSKFCGLVEGAGRTGGNAPSDPGFYHPIADLVFEAFGENRLIYASNFPGSSRYARYDQVYSLAVQLLQSWNPQAVSKVLVHNPRQIYQLDLR